MVCCASKLQGLRVLACRYAADLCHFAVLLLMQPCKYLNGLRPQVVLQVIIFVKQHPQSYVEWLACLNKARTTKMLVLHPWFISTMPTWFIIRRLRSEVDDTGLLCISRLCFSPLQWSCACIMRKHWYTSATLRRSLILLSRVSMQTFKTLLRSADQVVMVSCRDF